MKWIPLAVLSLLVAFAFGISYRLLAGAYAGNPIDRVLVACAVYTANTLGIFTVTIAGLDRVLRFLKARMVQK